MMREKILPALGSILLRLLYLTIRLRVEDRIGFSTGRHNKPVIMCFWHNRILGITLSFLRNYPHRSRAGVTVLTSPSRDGEILAQVARRLGMGASRGSSSRKGTKALLELRRLVSSGQDVAITPDGPRGPRYHLGPGAILLAQVTGAVLAPMHASFSRCMRLKTWDGFIIPLPFSTISVRVGDAISVPQSLSEEEFEEHRRSLEDVLKRGAD